MARGPWMIIFGFTLPLAVRSKTKNRVPRPSSPPPSPTPTIRRSFTGSMANASMPRPASGPSIARMGATFPLAMRSKTRTLSPSGTKISLFIAYTATRSRFQPSPRTLNDAQRRRFSLGAAGERQNGLSELLRNRELVVDFIVSETVHRPAEQRSLTFDFSNRLRVFIRQPGECRNLRMGHSVRHQDLFPLRVVGHGMRIAYTQRRLIQRTAADDSQRCHVTGCVQGVHCRGVIHEVRGPDLVVLQIHPNTGGVS